LKKFTIKEVSEKLNFNQHTLRYYEQIGMIEVNRRSSSNIREYTEKDVHELEYIKALKNIGFTLEDIKSYTLLKKNDKSTPHERKRILKKQHLKLTEQIDFLTHIKSIIEEKISCIDNREKR
jgi:DNA-binding transcriptional MerR regulator